MTMPFDVEAYPTELTLRRIATLGDPVAALDLARVAWHWPDFVSEELRPEEARVVQDDRELDAPGRRYVRFATGGWSGNEAIIAALQKNLGVRLCWQLSARGGVHIYRYPLEATP